MRWRPVITRLLQLAVALAMAAPRVLTFAAPRVLMLTAPLVLTFAAPLVLMLAPSPGTADPAEVARIAESAEAALPLTVGAAVPAVELRDVDDRPVQLRELIAGKSSVLVFYRGGWCPYCNLQLVSLVKAEAKLLDLGYEIVAISIDSPAKLRASQKKHGLNYRLLSDSRAAGAIAFGIAFQLDDAEVERLRTFGMDVEEASGEDHHILPVPSVFLAGEDGIIRFVYSNPDYKSRLDGAELVASAGRVREESQP